MTDGFNKNPDAHLAERLLQGLEAGIAAGGEDGLRTLWDVLSEEVSLTLAQIGCTNMAQAKQASE